MAKPKHRKKKPARRSIPEQRFYEALPLTATPPAVTPELTSQLKDGAAAFAAYVQTAQVRSAEMGRQMGYEAKQAWQATINRARYELTLAAPRVQRLITDATPSIRAYSQAARNDVLAGLRQLKSHLWNRRAKALYLAMAATGALSALVIGLTMSASTMALYAHDIATPSALLDKKKTGTVILDRNGQTLFEGYGAQNTQVVALSDVPASLKQATIAAEDPDFYQHPGFSWRGSARAAWVDLTHGGKLEGGSTLTQQLVKSALLTSNKTFERKYQELLLATALEQRYSKDKILEMYLNEVYYGEGAHGIAAAAQTYFHKSVKDLTVEESAMLAGLPLGPSRLDPNVDPQAATDRRNYVLDRMADLKHITRGDADAAKAKPVAAYSRTITIKAPHFVFYVLDQLRQQYGDQMVEDGGITVRTTLDLKKQEAAEQIVQTQISRLADHHASNGGLISLTPGTGDIISMVGSVDYNTPGFGAVNVTLSQLQPGSSFKPIAYVTAFTKGWNGATQVDDVPIQLPQGDGSLYIPQNYDGKFRGKVTLRRALANSLNIPAIKVIQFAGLDDTIAMAHNLGITSLNDRNRYGVSLVLGGGEVRPIDMATVYSVFANGGTRVEPRAILKVTDREGKDITKTKPDTPKPVLDPRYAFMITSILSDNTARTEEFGPNSPLKLSRPAAAKTGTTNDFRDNWTVGYTPDLVTAVWVGNNDHSAMSNVDGITGAAPIWHDYMEMATSDQPAKSFNPPSGIAMTKVCSDGGIANPWDSGYDEAFLSNQIPSRHCNSFSFNQTSPSPQPSSTPDPTIDTPKLHLPKPKDLFGGDNPAPDQGE